MSGVAAGNAVAPILWAIADPSFDNLLLASWCVGCSVLAFTMTITFDYSTLR